MLISVDLPAPFSPMMPWIAPRLTAKLTPSFAVTAPKRLVTPTKSIALLSGAGLVIDVVMNLDRAGDDLVARLVQSLLQRRGQERLVEVVDTQADAAFLEAERDAAGFPAAI